MRCCEDGRSIFLLTLLLKMHKIPIFFYSLADHYEFFKSDKVAGTSDAISPLKLPLFRFSIAYQFDISAVLVFTPDYASRIPFLASFHEQTQRISSVHR